MDMMLGFKINNMERFRVLVFSFSMLYICFGFLSCAGNSEDDNPPTLFVDDKTSVLSEIDGREQTITYAISNLLEENWSCENTPEWVIVTHLGDKLTVGVSENSSSATARTAVFTVTNKMCSVDITISQAVKMRTVWADRNVGVSASLSGDELKDRVAARGNFYTWAEADGICETWGFGGNSWRFPDKIDVEALKREHNDFVFGANYATYKSNEGDIYFPLSGTITNPTQLIGLYWTSTPNADYGVSLYIGTNGMGMLSGHKSTAYTLRCVRDVK